jgi:ATP diphosphatase
MKNPIMTNPISPSSDIGRLLEIMAALRTPGTGCPWDLEQTFATIAPYTLEEAYEVLDAIHRNDLAHLKDELGDLLLQVVYHARMAEEIGAFAFGDVVLAITSKMIRRHPHVFGSAAERAAGAAPGFWARIKSEENAGKSADAPGASLMHGVPSALPALTRAVKLQDKAAAVGFDWPGIGPVLDKLKEEIAELEEAALEADPRKERLEGEAPPEPQAGERIAEELGDLLFVIANIARHLKLDPEAALRAANQKFIRRFRHIEERLAALGRTPGQSTLEEMDGFWNEARQQDKAR